ncbi:MAG: Mur ligase domain-containing protein, partial [Bdellovibrionales bacterium]|nr:Mur ligase domain-containing protein [Bdellovibrionales bacterium]
MHLKNKTLHFVGIGGIGMCGLAELLYNLGCRVTGSDLHSGSQVRRLNKMGIPISIGHSPLNVHETTDIVIYSSAVTEDNVELAVA